MSRKKPQASFAPEEPLASPFAGLDVLRGAVPEVDDAPAGSATEDTRRFADKVVVRKERSGRGGKTVTVVEGVLIQGADLDDFVRRLRKSLGTSGSVESDRIILGGDIRHRVAKCLEDEGASRVVVGN